MLNRIYENMRREYLRICNEIVDIVNKLEAAEVEISDIEAAKDTTEMIKNLPDAYNEAAKIDGCSYWGIFTKVICPLIVPAVVTGCIFSFMWRWDDFLSALLYINKSAKYPVSLALKLFCDPGSSSDYGAMFAMATVSILPSILIFLFFQKYLVEGISTSGLKG